MATLFPAHDVSTGALNLPLWVRWIEALRRESAILFPAIVGAMPYRWQVLVSPLESPLPAAIVGLLAGGLAIWAVGRDRRAGLLMIVLFAVMTALSALIYPTYPRHVGVLVLLAIALEWIRVERDGAAPAPAFLGWLGVSAICGLWAAAWALFTPFSYGRQEVDWIKAHHLENAAWATYPGYVGSDIAAYFGHPTFNLQKGGCLDTFIRWDTHAYDDVEDDDLADAITQPGPFAYLASDHDLSSLHAPLTQLAHFNRGLGDNGVFLYSVQRPVQGVAPTCR